MGRIAVLDSGGQYCHLIARKVRELGVYAEIFPVGVDPSRLRDHAGIILSGGPSSVFDEASPQPQAGLFALGKPMLGICYGHQLIARYLGGTVERGDTHEFGSATLQLRADGVLFEGLSSEQQVWMSHGDHVARPPAGFAILADTDECEVAAMGHETLRVYGLQFHPEVVHTRNGSKILGNFLRNACGCAMDWQPQNRVRALLRQINETAGDRRVLLFLSGGVDSTVAYALVVRALGPERVEAVYVDTGFMRDRETDEIEGAFRKLDLGKLRVFQAADLFMGRLQGVADPETKRAIIGQAFVDVQDQILRDDRYAGQDWMLGQGTIYPDTIESGGTHAADVIKTHHNRVERIQELLDHGRVLEPLSEFYKDEVREIGRALGLPNRLIERHPFPGPGLAIRCICAAAAEAAVPARRIASIAERAGYSAFLLPLRSVGVQGDSRSYAQLTVLHGGAIEFSQLLPLSTAITNEFRQTNRVVACLAPREIDPSQWGIRPATLTPERVGLLQRVDRAVTDYLRQEGLYDEVWQCPVVLLPWGRGDGETVALRPVVSVDGMTASVAQLPTPGLLALADRLLSLDSVDAVVYDVSHKPPSTIEWE
ncbi:MAG: glutamine-hydrolyzing GMP synthase [Bryobacterales bacterium]|nr:glutamine-hydrolyzing GMP synthase [Bryobacterales bacterium]